MDSIQLMCNGAAGTVRREMMEGREFLVAPVIALRTGVLNDELISEEEAARHVEAWNGRPWVIDHPEINGIAVSANDPEILERQRIGWVFNAHWTDDRLKAEIWTDIDKARNTPGGDVVLQRLESGTPLEVSTAYFRDLDETPGQFNGNAYTGIARNLKPDHLAALPDAIGACSWADGCGAPRVNEGKLMKHNILSEARRPTFGSASSGEWSAPTLEDFGVQGNVADLSAEDKQRIAGHSLLGDPNADDFRNLLFFPVVGIDGALNERALDAVIGGRGSQADIPAAAKNSAQAMARRLLNSEFDRDLEVNEKFLSKMVRKVLAALRIHRNEEERMSKIDEILKHEVLALITNKEALAKFGEGELDKLIALASVEQEDVQDNQDEEEEEDEKPPEEEERPSAMAEIKAALDAFLSRLEALESAFSANANAEKNGLVEVLSKNDKLGLDADQLNNLDVPALQRLSRIIKPKTYAGQAGGVQDNSGDIKPLKRRAVLSRKESE